MTTQPTGASAAGPGLVEVTGLTKSYRSTPALRDYNLSLEAGHIVGLMGPNGCGKTTLLKILAGVLSDYQGTVTIDGHAPGVATKEIVSYLPDADFLNPEWTAAEAIRIYSTFFSDFDADKAASMVDFFALPTDRRLGEMSKGMGEKLQREFDPASLLIMSTHLISDIEHFVDYALFMKDGQVLLQGDADDLRATHGDSLDAIFRKEYR